MGLGIKPGSALPLSYIPRPLTVFCFVLLCYVVFSRRGFTEFSPEDPTWHPPVSASSRDGITGWYLASLLFILHALPFWHCLSYFSIKLKHFLVFMNIVLLLSPKALLNIRRLMPLSEGHYSVTVILHTSMSLFSCFFINSTDCQLFQPFFTSNISIFFLLSSFNWNSKYF